VPTPSQYTYVRTESGKVRCVVSAQWVTCESSGFPQAPIDSSGLHFNDAKITASGGFEWLNANIGGAALQNDLILNYGQTQHIQGWTILPSSDGTRFTNDATGHGMFVSIQDVHSF